MKKTSGITAAFLSAFIFGFTPILGKLSYVGGSNGVTLSFLRAAFAIPVLFVLLKIKRIPVGITNREAADLFRVGLFGPAATTLLLYESYRYISIGMATMLHFIYPVIVTFASVLLFKSKVGVRKMIALLLGTTGVMLLFSGCDDISTVGIVLALLSGLTYTWYMLGVEKTSLNKMHYFKLTFYFCMVSMVISGLFGLAMGMLTFKLTIESWVYSLLVSMFVAIGAITLFQFAITRIGATMTAILSTVEPITGVLLGAVILGEAITLTKAAGCILIFASTLLVMIATGRTDKKKGFNPHGG